MRKRVPEVFFAEPPTISARPEPVVPPAPREVIPISEDGRCPGCSYPASWFRVSKVYDKTTRLEYRQCRQCRAKFRFFRRVV